MAAAGDNTTAYTVGRYRAPCEGSVWGIFEESVWGAAGWPP